MLNEVEKSIVDKLKKCLGYDAPTITQQQFDKIVEYIMKNENTGGNPKELVWRLCGCYEGLNFNKVIDIFVDTRDGYYTSELVTYVDGNLDQEYLVKRMLETNDLEYINSAMSSCGNAMVYSLSKENYEIIKNFYNNKQANK